MRATPAEAREIVYERHAVPRAVPEWTLRCWPGIPSDSSPKLSRSETLVTESPTRSTVSTSARRGAS